MSISSQLLILNETKNNIKTQINLKGVEVTDEAFAEYPDKIRQIPNGGGTYESTIALYIEGKLRNVVIPDGTTKIGKCAFYGFSNINTITVPIGVTTIDNNAFESCSGVPSTLPDTVTTIGFFAFSYNSNYLSEITLPSSVTSIGEGAFCYNIRLTSITCLATTPPTLGTNAFLQTRNCPIYVPDESVLAYQTATNWIDYASRIKGISEKPQ